MADSAGKANAPPKSAWAQLTWDDLRAWAGPRSLERGRTYQRTHHVRDLAVSADGKLLAWVRGTERYATQVELRPEEVGEAKLASLCTCPVGHSGCKHAVAGGRAGQPRPALRGGPSRDRGGAERAHGRGLGQDRRVVTPGAQGDDARHGRARRLGFLARRVHPRL